MSNQQTQTSQDAIPGQIKTLHELLANIKNQFGDRTALRFHHEADPNGESEAISYNLLVEQVYRTANLFSAHNVTEEDTVAICLPNLPETLYCLFGAQLIGKSLSMNPFLESQAIIDLLNAANARILVIESPTNTARAAQLNEIKRSVPSLQAIVLVGGSACEVTGVIDNTVAYSAAIATQNGTSLNVKPQASDNTLAAIFHTGGTTGTPKLAQLTHGNEMYVAQTTRNMLGLNQDTVALCGLPLFHVNAVFVTTVNVLLAGGSTLFVTKNGFRTQGVISNLWSYITRYNVTFFSAVPTIVSSLLDRVIPPPSSHNLRFIICGAAPVSKTTLDAFRAKVGIPILEGYGLTEGTCVSTLNPLHGEQKIGSIGKALPGQHIICAKVSAINSIEKVCDVDEQGTILVRGPNVFAGYVNHNDNISAFTDGWLNTGDLGKQDSDGYFWLTGRAKDLIIRGGHNIDPKAIEDELNKHPDVQLSAAVGQPDSYAGELPCAYVMLNEGANTSREELLAYLKDTLKERAAIPVHIETMDKLPLTSVGKIFKPQLRHSATLRVINTLLQDIAGVTDIFLDVSPNSAFALVVRCNDNSEQIEEKLSKFTFDFRIEPEKKV